MKRPLIFFLFLTVSLAPLAGECDSSIQIIEEKDQVMIKNVSDRPIRAYFIASKNSTATDGSETRTYSGRYSGKDSLDAGQSIEIGKPDVTSKELSVRYVRFADGWRCGEPPPAFDTEANVK
jgi:hypothetical protein